jgi:GNAT superfamily N-acetyltransferase
MEVRRADLADIATYAALGRAAQIWLEEQGLGQYVPAAHDEYGAAIRTRVESGTLFKVEDDGDVIGFFNLEDSPSPWWPADHASALYLAGMIVARSARGRGVGRFIIEWSLREAAERGRHYVRLDCHAGNSWLCRYYEEHGFELRGTVEQHPGYEGCLYQRSVAPSVQAPTRRNR